MGLEESRRRLKSVEDKHTAEIARLEERSRELKGRLMESTNENTRLLREMADLSSRQFTLEKVTQIRWEEWKSAVVGKAFG